MSRQYRHFSADSHFECLPETWTHRVPAKFRDRAPRRIKLADGRDAIVEEGQPLEYRGTNLFAGKSPEEFNPVHLNFERSVGAGSPQQRLKEQDADGIDGELLFASEARNTKIKDKDAFLALIKAFNDYFIEEYCAVDPDRLVGVAVMPDIGADENIAEMKRCKEKGFKAVRLHTFPSGKSHADAGGRQVLCGGFGSEHADHDPYVVSPPHRRARCLSDEVSQGSAGRRPAVRFSPALRAPGDLSLRRGGSDTVDFHRRVRPLPEAADLLGGKQHRLDSLLLPADGSDL